MKINQRKTKVLLSSKWQIYANIALVGIMLETVQNLSHLGSKIISDRKKFSVTVCRITHAKQAYRKRNFFYLKNSKSDTKNLLIKLLCEA